MQRNNYFDFLRGMAILMVVGIHTFEASETHMSRSIVDTTALVRQLLNCAVPIFLAISGYFLSSKKTDSLDDYKEFWWKHMIKVYVPTLIASLPYVVLTIVHGTNLMVAVFTMLVCGYSIYYFIALILQYYALLPLFQKVNSWGGVLLNAIISLNCVAGITYLTVLRGYKLPLLVYAGFFPVWCMFFAMGCYLRKKTRNYSLFLPSMTIILGVVMSYIETYYLNINYGGGFGIKLSAFIYSMGIITLLFSAKIEHTYRRNLVNRTIEYIGSVSFSVYLYHIFVVNIFSKLLVSIKISWCTRWLTCLIITIAAIEFFKWIVPRRYHWCFGA